MMESTLICRSPSLVVRKSRLAIALFSLLLIPSQVSAEPSAQTNPHPDLDVACTVKWGYIDKSFKFKIMPTYEHAQSFSEGLAWASHPGGGHLDLLDPSGKIQLVTSQVYNVSPFVNGVSHSSDCTINKLGQLSTDSQSRCYATIEYKALLKPTPEYIHTSKEDSIKTDLERTNSHSSNISGRGIASLNENGALIYEDYSKLHKDTDEVLDCGPSPEPVRYIFSEGLLHVRATTPNNRLEHDCYINSHNEVVLELPPDILGSGNFYEGLAPAAVEIERIHPTPEGPERRVLLGFIDKNGKFVIKPQFNIGAEMLSTRAEWLGMPIRFSDDLLVLPLDDHEVVISKTGKILKKYPTGTLGHFSNGLAPHSVLVDSNGNIFEADDKSHGYQSKPEYASAVLMLVQKKLHGLSYPKPITFEIIPNQLKPIMVGGADLQNPKLVPDVVQFPNDSPQSWKLRHVPAITATSQDTREMEARYPEPQQTIKSRLEAIKLPMRSIALGPVVLSFVLENGEVRPGPRPFR